MGKSELVSYVNGEIRVKGWKERGRYKVENCMVKIHPDCWNFKLVSVLYVYSIYTTVIQKRKSTAHCCLNTFPRHTHAHCSLLTENKSKCLVHELLINKLLSVASWFALLLIHLFFCRKQRALQIWRLKLLRALQVLRCVCTNFWITNRKEVTTTSIETVVGVKIWDMLNESCSHKIFQNCQKIYLIP